MSADKFQFGIFEFRGETKELRRDGELVRLQAQPAQVLGVLLQRAGQVVSREELQREVWGEETFVDFDRGLNFCMAQIRSALDDDSTAPRFIRTIPKRGYQFIAPVIGSNAAAGDAPTAATSQATKNQSERFGTTAGAQKFSTASIAAIIFAGVVILAVTFVAGYRSKAQQLAKRPPVVAIVRFDNETAEPLMTKFSDGLTDSVVERLTALSDGHFSVIGNAQILRAPRDARDLTTIGSALGAKYIVLGQVQTSGAQTRILAHLIRLPEQTHIWVVRVDRAIGEPLSAESELAQKIGAEFAPRIARDASGAPLPEAASH
jgi:DNA-binding winged helix-turn-helix (wHTH) protein/TolB-like protein